MRAISICVSSPVIAVDSTHCARGDTPSRSSPAVISAISPCAARDSNQQRSVLSSGSVLGSSCSAISAIDGSSR